MGEVFRAYDERLEREVALKFVSAARPADEVARKRFRREALILSRLNHPNLATIYDFDSQAGVDFLVMELVPGMSLSAMLAAAHWQKTTRFTWDCNWRMAWRRRTPRE